MSAVETSRFKIAILASTIALSTAMVPGLVADSNWPSWRGPDATGWSPSGNPPTTWSESDNVAWKVAIPGKGHASPVVWEDRVFLTTAQPVVEKKAETEELAEGERPRGIEPVAQRYLVLALARTDGSLLWQREAANMKPAGGTHRDGTWASASPDRRSCPDRIVWVPRPLCL